jgi:hypothetical protein
MLNISKTDGAATTIAALTQKFGSVGMEHHPHNGLIYACTNPDGANWQTAPLFRIEPNGTVHLVAETELPGNCDNLGAPWGDVIIE